MKIRIFVEANIIRLLLFFFTWILVSAYYLSVTTSGQKNVTESFLLFIISALLIIIVITANRKKIQVNYFDLICTGFILYLVFKNLFFRFDIFLISYLLFFLFLYFGLKILFTTNRIPLIFILFFGVTILFTYIVYAALFFYSDEKISNLYFIHKSIFSIILASQIALIIPLSISLKTNKSSLQFINWISLFIVIASVILLGFTNGRSGWLGFILAMIYISYCYLKNRYIKKIFLYSSVSFAILILIFLFFYKPGSSRGRLLIYKVSSEMLKDHWLSGIGSGQFKIEYNKYQAAYFATHDINNKEAMLADNTFFAFNDFFQIIIENGIIGLLFLLFIILAFIKQLKGATMTPENKSLHTASIASLICIVTGSLFSYSLQIFPIIFHAIICLAILNSFAPDNISLSKNVKRISIVIFSIIGILLVVQFYFNFCFFKKSLEASELEKDGFRREAIKKYSELQNVFIKDGNVSYLYARELYYANQSRLAASVLSETKNYHCSNDVYKLSALIEQALHHYVQAEKDYKTAVFMVPNRMISRYDLLNFYIERNDTLNIIYWSKLIINMPVKVPSQITMDIQKKTKEVLVQINK